MRKFLISPGSLSLALALSVAGAVSAQSDGLAVIQAQFDAYRMRTLQEKIFVHADKPDYLAGELCWFKLYCVDGSSHKPLDLSKLAYVDVLDRDDRTILQGKIALIRGEGSGSFYLPLTLASGNYKLRAYTNWMKNFGPDYYYEQTLTIINTLKPLTPDGVRPLAATAAAPDGAGGAGSGGATIAFFPEGGNLVKELSSVVAFRATDGQGRGVDCRGVIVDERQDTVVSFVSLHSGIGQFAFTPSGDHRYKAMFSFPAGAGGNAAVGGPDGNVAAGGADSTLTKDLPVAGDQGFVMRVREEDAKRMRVTVHARAGASPWVYLFARTGQSHPLALKMSLVQDSASLLVDKDSLGEGVTQWTVFDANLRPVCERLSFKRPAEPSRVDVGADRQQYSTRKKVSLDIALSGKAGTMPSLSLSVYRDDSLQTGSPGNIYGYLWLGSDLKGRIDSPEYYITEQGPAADQALDNLMLTHGWRRFRWESIRKLADSQMVFANPIEYSGHVVTGRLTDTRTGEPLRDRLCTLSVPGINYRFQNGRTDAAGRLFFDVKDFYGSTGIVLHSGTLADSPCKTEIFSPFSEQYAGDPPGGLDLSDSTAAWLTRRSLGMQEQNIFATDSMQRLRVSFPDTLHFFGVPDQTYMLDDYTRFITMEEVIREYVANINVNHVHGNLHILVEDILRKQFFDEDNTLVLLDGVPVPDDKIFFYDPLKVKKLEVLNKRYFLGAAAYSGVLSFTTYRGDYPGLELDRHSILVDYEGMQWEREFYAPSYATEEESAARLPDFRDLMFWSPEIHFDAQGKSRVSFYTSDLPGNYKIVIQGIGPDGRISLGAAGFEVR
jgi:hypothetical protein